jgi:hypothetical protein
VSACVTSIVTCQCSVSDKLRPNPGMPVTNAVRHLPIVDAFGVIRHHIVSYGTRHLNTTLACERHPVSQVVGLKIAAENCRRYGVAFMVVATDEHPE